MINRGAFFFGLASTLFWVAGCGVTGTRVPIPPGGGDGGTNEVFDFSLGTVCNPGDPPMCDGDSIAVCRSNGTGYDYQFCPTGCTNGECTCNPGDKRCNGAAIETCQGDGTWMITMNCAQGTQCLNGVCSEARCDDETMGTNPHALPTNAWPRYRHDNRNSGSTPTAVANMPKLVRKISVGGCSLNGGGMGSGPVVNQSNIVFITGGDMDPHGGSLHSFDAMGKELWFFPAGTGFASSTPAVRADGTSYFSSQTGGNLYAVTPKGMQQWNFMTGLQADSDPVVTKDGTLVYSSDDGSAYALDANGKLLWKSDQITGPGEVDGGIAETCDGKIVVGGTNGWFELDAATGKTIWMVAATGDTEAILSSPYVTADGTVYGFDSGGMGYAIDKTGKVLWKNQIGPQQGFGGAATGKIGNTLFTLLNDGALWAVDATTGKSLWNRPAGGAGREINAGPITDGNSRVYVNGNDGFVYAFDTKGNQIWKIASSGIANPQMDVVGTPAIGNDGTLYVPGNDGNLYVYK
jgi:outer membrane protein assembly factor BamB